MGVDFLFHFGLEGNLCSFGKRKGAETISGALGLGSAWVLRKGRTNPENQVAYAEGPQPRGPPCSRITQ